MSNLCINILLSTRGVTQFTNLPFTSACVFEGVPIAADGSGIYTLETSETDDGEEINSLIEFFRTDFGIDNEKRIRKLWVGYKSKGDLTFKISVDEGDWEEFTLVETGEEFKQKSASIPVPRNLHGRYWQFAIENPDGVDFSIDSINAVLVILNKKVRSL
jgi:hypothetical protein